MQGETKAEPDPLDLENYYEALSPFTFATYFLDMPRETAQAIVRAYDDKRMGIDEITEEQQNLITKLANDIDAIVQNFPSKEAFVRLSTRSPKDYALRAPKTKRILQKELEGIDEGDEIGQIIALIRTSSKALKSSSGAEAVQFFTNSERSYQDLSRRILASDDESDFAMQVVIREWVEIEPELEFRGFATNKTLNALTQYYKACYVPRLAKEKAIFQERILALYDQVKDLIKVDRYVIDFAVTNDKVYVVELNHWGKTASSSLFDWTKDHEVMHNGPFEMRVVEKPFENGKAAIARPLRQMMAEFYSSWDEQAISTLSGEDGESKKKKKQKKVKYIAHFKKHTACYKLQQKSLDGIDLEKLFARNVVKIEAVWGGKDQFVAHWELPVRKEQEQEKEKEKEKEKGKEKEKEKEMSVDEASEEPNLWEILGINSKIRPSDDKKKSPHTFPTMLVICVMEVILLRHEKFLIALTKKKDKNEEKKTKKEKKKEKEKEKEKEDKLTSWKRVLVMAYDYLFTQYGVNWNGKTFSKTTTKELTKMMEDAYNCCMLMLVQFDFLERK